MPNERAMARVFHADLWGDRDGKYAELAAASIETTEWTAVDPTHPHYLFPRRDTTLLPEYEGGWAVPTIFSLSGDPAPGIVTTHDEFAISWTPEEAAEKVRRLLATSNEDEARAIFRLCTQSQWNYERARSALSTGKWTGKVVPIFYRPFDRRWTVFDRHVAVHRRERVMKHMLGGENLALGTIRSLDVATGWEHVFATDGLIQHHTVSLKEVNFLFPIYIYSSSTQSKDDPQYDLQPGEAERAARRPNLAPEFIADLTQRLGMTFVPDGAGDLEATVGPEDVFHYMYAVFHSPTYRDRYAEFLKIDFPRLPLTTDVPLFRALATHGAELTALHLMDTHPPLITRYPVAGDDTVDKARYTPNDQRVWINAKQYFEGVPETVWEHRVGGYQVAEKWLKDRKGRTLTYDDLTHYQRTLAALARTRDVMDAIDQTIERHGGWPLAGSAPA